MKIFLTDGTPSAFFTAVFDAFKENDCIITSKTDIQLSFGSEVISCVYDEEKCERVRAGIAKYEKNAEEYIITALRSCNPLREQISFAYIKKLMSVRAPIYKCMSLQEVIDLNELIYKVNGETHRLKGLLRFIETNDGVLYAPYSPDNNITDLLTAHFADRFGSERFVIHDIKLNIAGIYNGRNWTTCYASEAEIRLSENEKNFENLWKKYYKAVNINERPHEKQMKGSMPVRYWKFLPEKRDNN